MQLRRPGIVAWCGVACWYAFACKFDDPLTVRYGAGGESGEAGGESGEAGGESGERGAGEGGNGGSAESGAGEGGAPVTRRNPCAEAWSMASTGETCSLKSLEEGLTLSRFIDEDTTLEGGKVHYLDGNVRVRSGTLTIEPCTKIVALTSSSALVVRPGAKLHAVGKPEAPIVFTSAKKKGHRSGGDWEGLMILGNARAALGESALPYLTTTYGSAGDEHDTESSGKLAYVRVEFAGGLLEQTQNVARAGITFAGVGSGTEAHHLEVLHSLGDCFEWRGGNVDAHHLIAIGCRDDLFDAQEGYRGRVQFAFGQQWSGAFGELSGQDQLLPQPTNPYPGSNGLELDTVDPYLPAHASAAPLTAARWSNVTLCGQRDYDVLELTGPPNARKGVAVRGNASGSVRNALATGFHEGFDFLASQDVPDDAPFALSSTTLGDNLQLTHALGDPAWFLEQPENEVTGFDGVCDCWSTPPAPFPPERIPGIAPEGMIDEEASYRGAFEDARPESNWLAAPWVDFSPK